MSVFTFEKEHSTVAPAKLYKALAKDSDNIIPKVVGAIQIVEIVEGNGGPGTIKKITAVEGGKSSYVLHKVDAIDEANLVYNYSIVGETGVEDILEKVSFETKVLPGPHGGSVVKITIKYHTKDNAALSEEVRGATKAKGTALSKAVEGAGSRSVPHAAPHRGGYSSPLLQLYGGYPQPQLDYGYLPQPGYGYHPQPQPGSGYHPQPQPGSGYFPPPGYGYFPLPGSGYFPPPGYGYFPPPGYGYAPPVQNPGTNNLFAKFGAALTAGVLSEFVGNMISEATSDTGA